MRIAKILIAAWAAGLLSIAALVLPVQAAEVWKSLGAPGATPTPAATGHVNANGVKIYYAIHGSGKPLILLHGGLGNTDYWGSQIKPFAAKYRVIAIASRGHGRSTRDEQPYGYSLMAKDVLAVMDALGIAKASIVGWSDGGNIGLDMAINNPNRLVKLFAFGANFSPAGVKPSVETDATFGAYVEKTSADYAKLSATPKEFDNFVSQISAMWGAQPNFTDDQLKSIPVPVAIVVGEHDEAIKPEHTKELAAKIAGSKLIIMPGISHFGMWQDPEAFNKSVLDYLGG